MHLAAPRCAQAEAKDGNSQNGMSLGYSMSLAEEVMKVFMENTDV